MKGQFVGYIRISSSNINPVKQLDDISLDRVFTDYVSGKSIHRPELKKLLSFIREGDTLYIQSMDRLARNLEDLQKIVHSRGLLNKQDIVTTHAHNCL